MPLKPGRRAARAGKSNVLIADSRYKMGLLSNILFFPIMGPVHGIRWTLGKVQRVAEEQLTDDTAVKQDLMELQMQLELGDIDDAQYLRREAELMERLREVREWRERLGQPTVGGPVRVARGDADDAGDAPEG